MGRGSGGVHGAPGLGAGPHGLLYVLGVRDGVCAGRAARVGTRWGEAPAWPARGPASSFRSRAGLPSPAPLQRTATPARARWTRAGRGTGSFFVRFAAGLPEDEPGGEGPGGPDAVEQPPVADGVQVVKRGVEEIGVGEQLHRSVAGTA